MVTNGTNSSSSISSTAGMFMPKLSSPARNRFGGVLLINNTFCISKFLEYILVSYYFLENSDIPKFPYFLETSYVSKQKCCQYRKLVHFNLTSTAYMLSCCGGLQNESFVRAKDTLVMDYYGLGFVF